MKKLFAMLLALCLMCGAVSAFAEAAETQEAKIGNVTFQIPAELVLTTSEELDGMSIAGYSCDNYTMMITTIDWNAVSLPFDFTDGDEQADNFFWFYYLTFQSEDDAFSVLNTSSRHHFDMLHGKDIVYKGVEGLGLATHVYRNTGFMILTMGANEYATGTHCIEITTAVAASFRLDGVSEEEMIADAMQKYVVITNSSANVRSGPGGDYDKVTTARQGDTFPLIGEDGNWYIIDVNGRTGYVTKSLSAIQE